MRHLEHWLHIADTTAMHPLLNKVCFSTSEQLLAVFITALLLGNTKVLPHFFAWKRLPSSSTTIPCSQSTWLCDTSLNTPLSEGHLPPAQGPSSRSPEAEHSLASPPSITAAVCCWHRCILAHFGSPHDLLLPHTLLRAGRALSDRRIRLQFFRCQQCVICSCCCMLALSIVSFAYSCLSPLVTVHSISDENFTLRSVWLHHTFMLPAN